MTKPRVWTPNEIIDIVSKYMDSNQTKLVKKAYQFAKIAHRGQKYESMDKYIAHPTQVAAILARLGMDSETVSAGFLHNIVKNTGVEINDVRELFGNNIATIVNEVTQLGYMHCQSNNKQSISNYRKFMLSKCTDIRVMIVKLADRLHNMRTLRYLSNYERKQESIKTMQIYAPIADRLGMGTIKWEMEDISLRYLNPKEYYNIVHLMNLKRNQRISYINSAIVDINKSLKHLNIKNYKIYGRPKHLYSIYHKMYIKNYSFNQIYDLLAIRIITNSISECYSILGEIHNSWEPLPGRFKDYIARPKVNMYQSLHTTVIGPQHRLLEIQIRTKNMHQIAEYGVAAHWAYKRGVHDKINENSNSDKMNQFKHVIKLQENKSNSSNLSYVGRLFNDYVYAFTPKGDVFELPKRSHPLDLAYNIHSEVGNHTVGAQVNNKIVPLDYYIQNGDEINIMTSSSASPNRDWLSLVTSNKSKHKIKQFFKKKSKGRNIDLGKDTLRHIIQENNYSNSLLNDDNLNRVASDMHYINGDALLAAIGFGDVQPIVVIHHLNKNGFYQNNSRDAKNNDEYLMSHYPNVSTKKANLSDSIMIGQINNLLVHLSHCCYPVPGDDILGYITHGNGVSVHRVNCSNIINSSNNNRLVNVQWAKDRKIQECKASIEINGFNYKGLINDIFQSINNVSNNIVSLNKKSNYQKNVSMNMVLKVKNIYQLKTIMERIKGIHNVYDVFRPIN